MNHVLSAAPGRYQVGSVSVPKPVLIFAGLLLLLTGLKVLTGEVGANQPATIARAVGEGLMSVFHDDKGLKNLVLIFTKDGRNNDGTAELRDYGAGLGRVLFGGNIRAGGKLYFHQYRHSSGVILNGGPLDVEMSNADTKNTSRLRIQGSVTVTGSDQPVYIQLEFVSPSESYTVEKMEGKIKINGQITSF